MTTSKTTTRSKNASVESLESDLAKLLSKRKLLDEKINATRRTISAWQRDQRKAALRAMIGERVHIPQLIGNPGARFRGHVGVLLEVKRKFALVDFGTEQGKWNVPWEWLAPEGSNETVSKAAGWFSL